MRSYVVLPCFHKLRPPFGPGNLPSAGKLVLTDERLPSKLLHCMQIDPLRQQIAGGSTATTLVLESFDRFPAARSFAAAAALPAAPPSFFFFFFFAFSATTSPDFEFVATLLLPAFFNVGSEMACRRAVGVEAF